jgi:hypothetical protein
MLSKLRIALAATVLALAAVSVVDTVSAGQEEQASSAMSAIPSTLGERP